MSAGRERYATAVFGRLPRRAAGVPGIFVAQSSHRSACFAPRLASVYVSRRTAPLPSSTSLPQLSQTSTVFLATNSSFEREIDAVILRSLAAGAYSPGSKQRKRCALLRVEVDIPRRDDSQFRRAEIVDRSTVEILLDNRG